MHYDVTQFNNMKIALKGMEPFIRDGEHLQTGKPFEKFDGLRSKELPGNWLVCAAPNSIRTAEELAFTSDLAGSDVLIYDNAAKRAWPTEHFVVPRQDSGGASAEEFIRKAIATKQEKGRRSCASGKTLVVFVNAGLGDWHPNKVTGNFLTPILWTSGSWACNML